MARSTHGRIALLAASLAVAIAACPSFARDDAPAVAGKAIDPKAFGRPDSLLFWTPEQQRVGYPNMDRLYLTREISRGNPNA
ncbi:MAG: hypothetical protein ACREUC_20970, partial [Steroidobacteraceae bacterium]